MELPLRWNPPDAHDASEKSGRTLEAAGKTLDEDGASVSPCAVRGVEFSGLSFQGWLIGPYAATGLVDCAAYGSCRTTASSRLMTGRALAPRVPVIVVLRLGHRRTRDARVTTHVCLAARAFGADAVWVVEKDAELEKSLKGVVERFGGPFEVKTGVAWRPAMRRFPGLKVHLTMYGRPIEEAEGEVVEAADGRDVMLVVGASKVPGEVFGMADFNIAVTNQPHSEVAALTIALDRLGRGAWARKRFKGGRVAIRPSARGKVVVAQRAREEE